MKVGILTYHDANNYGAVLQAYALLAKLKELGHNVYVIDRVRTFKGWRYWYHGYSYKHHFSWCRFKEFCKYKLSPKTSMYKTTELIKKDFPNLHLNAVVVGSDQVWRDTFMGHNFFLDFVSGDCKRISYAASFGLSEWTNSGPFTLKAKRLLQKFDKISVREKTGVDICKNVFGVNAELVLDPTLLWNADFYIQTLLRNEGNARENAVVASYILGKNKDQQLAVQTFAKKEKLKNVNLLDVKSFFKGHYTVEEWLQQIRAAQYVITNSFHATVFCILFHKHFVVLDNKSGGSDRIITLLEAVGLRSLLIETSEDLLATLNIPIDYEKVDKKIAELRMNSLNFLKSAL